MFTTAPTTTGASGSSSAQPTVPKVRSCLKKNAGEKSSENSAEKEAKDTDGQTTPSPTTAMLNALHGRWDRSDDGISTPGSVASDISQGEWVGVCMRTCLGVIFYHTSYSQYRVIYPPYHDRTNNDPCIYIMTLISMTYTHIYSMFHSGQPADRTGRVSHIPSR